MTRGLFVNGICDDVKSQPMTMYEYNGGFFTTGFSHACAISRDHQKISRSRIAADWGIMPWTWLSLGLLLFRSLLYASMEAEFVHR